eukprot:s3181_g2.t1
MPPADLGVPRYPPFEAAQLAAADRLQLESKMDALLLEATEKYEGVQHGDALTAAKGLLWQRIRDRTGVFIQDMKRRRTAAREDANGGSSSGSRGSGECQQWHEHERRVAANQPEVEPEAAPEGTMEALPESETESVAEAH